MHVPAIYLSSLSEISHEKLRTHADKKSIHVPIMSENIFSRYYSERTQNDTH